MSVEQDGTALHAAKPELFLRNSFDNRYPAFSPDGRWMAYTSNEGGTYQVYVRAFPDKGGRWQVSSAGGSYPLWSPNGRELFFRTGDNQIMVANYTTSGDSFLPDKPRLWSEEGLLNFGLIGTASYDVAPDGNRIAALMPVETSESQQAQNHVVFLMNFFDELRRKVPQANNIPWALTAATPGKNFAIKRAGWIAPEWSAISSRRQSPNLKTTVRIRRHPGTDRLFIM